MSKRAGVSLAAVVLATCGLWAAGTTLNITLDAAVIDCIGGNVSLAYTVSSSASPNTDVTETLTKVGTGVVDTASYTIPANGWVNGGRIKTHDDVYVFQPAGGLVNGDYVLEVCATQPGAGGNLAKTVCGQIPFTVNCWQEDDGNPCNDSAPFGEVLGRTQIRDDATAQIQFKGDFGSSSLVEIRKDGVLVDSAYINRSGDSCNYHANWKFTTDSGADLFGNLGPGAYSVKVSGNGNDLEFGVTLTGGAGGPF